MARHRTSPLEDFFLIVIRKIPWWVFVFLALISFSVLHFFATRPLVNIGPVYLLKRTIQMLAMFGQYLILIFIGLVALLSAMQKKLYGRTESRFDVAALNEMSWEDFERLVGEYYERVGFQVTRTGSDGPDGGIDLVLRKDGETHLVQCKQWKAYKVGVQPVREFTE